MTAILRLGKFKAKEALRSPNLFFFRSLLNALFTKHEWENLYFSISLTKQVLQLAYGLSAFFYLAHFSLEKFSCFALIIGVSVALDYAVRIAASVWSKQMLKASSFVASLYLMLPFPLIVALLQIGKKFLGKVSIGGESFASKTKLRELIRESDLHQHLDLSDQKLISSFVNFKERVAKEVMVPRIDLFALAEETSIREAITLFAAEGYSRIPVYRETLDQISGVVLYKDLLKYYAKPDKNLEEPLEKLAKPVLYAPETKKITSLLQEFRNQQIHMAIIVDEYGGTEGIVTIEDILEELVGEIEDEYDSKDKAEFWELPEGGWAVDAKMSILAIEEQLGIHIPPSPEYETIGGYVFHCAGTIPSKGWRLSHDNFDLEVLSSNERSLKKIKLVRSKPK